MSSSATPRPRNNPDLEKAVAGLWMAMEACADLIDEHRLSEAMDCDCIQCEDARGVLFMARNCEAILTSQMIGSPAKLRKLRAYGFPSAQALADMIEVFRDDETSDQEEDNSDE